MTSSNLIQLLNDKYSGLGKVYGSEFAIAGVICKLFPTKVIEGTLKQIPDDWGSHIVNGDRMKVILLTLRKKCSDYVVRNDVVSEEGNNLITDLI